MSATSSCPNCGALLDISSVDPGTRMSCGDCGKPFVVGETPRAGAPPQSRPHAAAVRETPASALPTARPLASARPAREFSLPSPDDSPGTGRTIVITVCVLLLLAILSGMGFLISWAQSRGGGRSPTTAPVVWKPVRVQPPVEDDDLALRREIIEDEKRASEDAMRALEEKLSKCEREIMAVRDIELEDWEGESPEERLRLREMIRREMIGKIRSEMRHLEWFRRRELDRAQAIREKLEKNDAEKAKKQP